MILHFAASARIYLARQRGRSWKKSVVKSLNVLIVPDEIDAIQSRLLESINSLDIDLIVTSGGTGLAPRDVTPEATAAVIEKTVPGMSELMRFEGMKANPRSALSRGIVGFSQ